MRLAIAEISFLGMTILRVGVKAGLLLNESFLCLIVLTNGHDSSVFRVAKSPFGMSRNQNQIQKFGKIILL